METEARAACSVVSSCTRCHRLANARVPCSVQINAGEGSLCQSRGSEQPRLGFRYHCGITASYKARGHVPELMPLSQGGQNPPPPTHPRALKTPFLTLQHSISVQPTVRNAFRSVTMTESLTPSRHVYLHDWVFLSRDHNCENTILFLQGQGDAG